MVLRWRGEQKLHQYMVKTPKPRKEHGSGSPRYSIIRLKEDIRQRILMMSVLIMSDSLDSPPDLFTPMRGAQLSYGIPSPLCPLMSSSFLFFLSYWWSTYSSSFLRKDTWEINWDLECLKIFLFNPHSWLRVSEERILGWRLFCSGFWIYFSWKPIALLPVLLWRSPKLLHFFILYV